MDEPWQGQIGRCGVCKHRRNTYQNAGRCQRGTAVDTNRYRLVSVLSQWICYLFIDLGEEVLFVGNVEVLNLHQSVRV